MRAWAKLYNPEIELGARAHAVKMVCLAPTARRFEVSSRRFFQTFFALSGCYFISVAAGATVPAYLPDNTSGTSRRRYRQGLSEDLWFQRCPPRPGISVVRHSDASPFEEISKSSFCSTHLTSRGHRYGASLVFWLDQTFMGSLTLTRTLRHGDFSVSHMDCLAAAHDHLFAEAVVRLHERYSLIQERYALKQAIRGNSDCCAIVERPDKIVSASKSALRRINSWECKAGMTHKLGRKLDKLPAEIGNWCANPQSCVPQHPRWKISMQHLRNIDRRPTSTHLMLHLFATEKGPNSLPWRTLSPAEQDLVSEIAAGKSNAQIAEHRKTALKTVKNQISILLSKLGLVSRVQVAVAMHRRRKD